MTRLMPSLPIFPRPNPKMLSGVSFFLSGKRFKRLLSSQKLRLWCQEAVKIPDWLFLESYARVGDTAEVIALLLRGQQHIPETRSLSQWIQEFIFPLREMPEGAAEEQHRRTMEKAGSI